MSLSWPKSTPNCLPILCSAWVMSFLFWRAFGLVLDSDRFKFGFGFNLDSDWWRLTPSLIHFIVKQIHPTHDDITIRVNYLKKWINKKINDFIFLGKVSKKSKSIYLNLPTTELTVNQKEAMLAEQTKCGSPIKVLKPSKEGESYNIFKN